MRNNRKFRTLGLATVMSFSLLLGMNVAASEETADEATEETTVDEASEEEAKEESFEENDPYAGMDGNRRFVLDIEHMTDDDWSGLAMTDTDMIQTGVNIRETASEDGRILGCIYKGAALHIIDKGSEWSEVQSGDVWGYIRNEYLVFGADGKGVVEKFGIDGVMANWDDVHVFEDADPNAKTIYWAGAYETFPVVEDQGHWISIRLKSGKLSEEQRAEANLDPESTDMELLSFVSIEDVTKVILMDTAVPSEEYYPEEEYEEEYYEEPAYTDTSSYSSNTSSGSSGTTYTAPANTTTNNNSTSTSTGTSTNTGSSDTGSTATDTTGTSTDTSSDYSYDSNDEEYEEDDSGEDVYTDDNTSTDDGGDEEIEEIEDAEEYSE